ncbi:XRE family transcriptional regulator [Pseudomonas moorei]|nr:XRE family transcriptional regulator [Pseudomonas moorei]
MTIFSKRLKQARKAGGFSQERLGIEAGIEPASASARLNQYEKGVHEPGENTARQIAQVLDLPLAFFYCEDDDAANLLKIFHQMNAGERKKVVAMIEGLSRV